MRPSSRILRLLLFAYALVCLIAIVFFYVADLPPTTPVLEADSSEYVHLAHTILQGAPYSLSVGESVYPDSFRTPGYPLFLAYVIGVFGSVDWVVPVQLLLFACTAIILFLLGELFFSRRVGYLAYGLWLFNPIVYYTTVFVWSDFFFTFLLLCAVYAGVTAAQKGRSETQTILVLLSGTLVGCAILVRPVAQFLPLVVLICAGILMFFLNFKLKTSVRRGIYLMSLWSMACMIIVTPWIVRNYQVFDVAGISSVSAYNVLFYNLSLHNIYLHGESVGQDLIPKEVPLDDISRFRSYEYADLYQERVKEYLNEHWQSYLLFHVIKMIPFFLASSYMDLALYISPESQTTYRSVNFSHMLLDLNVSGFLSMLWGRIAARDGFFFLFLTNIAGWGCIYLLAVWVVMRGFLSRQSPVFKLFLLGVVLLIGYVSVLTGPIAMPRYRLPIEPYLFLLASAGMVMLYDVIRERRRERKKGRRNGNFLPNKSSAILPSMKNDTMTAQAFANSWNNLPKGSVYTREQFEDWMAPLDRKDVQGKTVLELGCGNASLMVHMVEWKPSFLEGVDLGDSVVTAEVNMAGREDVRVTKADLVKFEGEKQYDVVYCIGVLHHLQSPEKGFESVLRNTKPGGRFHCWVYAEEGNWVIIHIVDPIRKIASKLPWWVTKYLLATPLVFPFYLYAKLLKVLPKSPMIQRLPLYDYALWIARREFAFFRHVAFDQLVTPQTAYIPRATIEQWLSSRKEIEQESSYIIARNGNSWKFGGRKGVS